MRVSVGKIRKFDPKFERKTIRRSIFSLDEAETTEARERTSRPWPKPTEFPTKYKEKRQAAQNAKF